MRHPEEQIRQQMSDFKSPYSRNNCTETVQDRAQLIKTKGLCFKCLRHGHGSEQCKGSTCKKCKRKNNSLLHLEANNNSRTTSTAPTVTTSSTSPQEASNQAAKTVYKNKEKITAAAQSQIEEEEDEEVYLPTAIVSVDNNGRTTNIRAILDSGSQINLITEDAVKSFGLKKEKADGRVFGLGVQEVNNSKGSVNLILKTKDEDSISIRATVSAKLTSKLPSHHVNVSGWTKLQDLNHADTNFNQPSTVDLIIGAGHYEEMMIGENRIKELQKPITYRLSCFVWLAIGRESQLEKKSTQLQSFFICSEPDKLQRFWEIEEIPTRTQWTSELQKCGDHFKSTTRRNSEGRFVVKLQTLGRLVPSSEKKTTEPRFSTGETTCTNSFNLDTWKKFPEKKFICLPQIVSACHCVIKDASSTINFRVVFDASAKSASGVSIIDRLVVGPQFQKDLFGILIRFRFHHVALSADIATMYRQVQPDDEDKDFHRVLWKNPNNTEVKKYRMTRVTYGIASSSYQSIRPLKALADSCTNSNLRLVINIDMYVDNLLTGALDVELASQLQDEIIETLKTACFDVRKWISSVSSLVEQLSSCFCETSNDKKINSNDYTFKTLGIKWRPVADHFTFTVCLDKEFPSTKRKMLPEVKKLFETFG
ncbi:uncharacterized protein LOC142352093 [Convolutriloba macropyga]|uniref:uncharacterized protein LOC142352093 n=1 Tax=Convolutriloba macropyga TaxID=536237 RepID=UPI003F51C60D